MPRAREPKTQRRHRQINIRVTDDDHARLTVEAVSAGMKLTSYCELLILKRKIEVATMTIHRMEPMLFAQLRRIGNNINQVAHAINSGLPPHVVSAAKAMHALLHTLLRDDLLNRRIEALRMRIQFDGAAPPETGSSFKGVCAYILHDASKSTAERVDWTATQNLASRPEDAWFEMFETYRDSDELKERAGRSARGCKNTAPVLHYMLSWHKDDKPSSEHMRETALSSLKALGLEDHQAVLSAHHDKDHLHVHIVVNTVNPDSGVTAGLKFTKLDLSKWAEAYEREHGVHCEERIKNNAERERHAKARKLDPTDMLIGRKADATKQLMGASKIEVKARKPYVPVKHKATSRKQWFEKKDVTDRMKAMRLVIDAEIISARDATWARQSKERDALDTRSEAAVDQARERIRSVYQPKWRNLYYNQKKEAKFVGRVSGDLLERAVYVFQNRERLGVAGKPLTLRQMLPLIRSGAKLQSRVADIHEQERRALARESKFESKALTDAIWQRHKSDMGWLRDKHSAERQSERDAQAMQRKSVSFEMAKAALSAERAQAPRQFTKAPDPVPERQPMPPPERFKQPSAPSKMAAPPPLEQQFKQAVEPTAPQAAPSRSEQIKRDMAEWRRRNEGNDFGREL